MSDRRPRGNTDIHLFSRIVVLEIDHFSGYMNSIIETPELYGRWRDPRRKPRHYSDTADVHEFETL